MFVGVLFATALASPLVPDERLELLETVRHAEVITRDGETLVLVLGGTTGWLLDPDPLAVRRLLPAGGTDAALLDVDGDGARELLVCGAQGVVGVRFEGDRWPLATTFLDGAPCRAITTVRTAEGDQVAVAGATLRLLGPEAGRLAERAALGDLPEGPALLVAHQDSLYASTIGTREILHFGPLGVSRLAAGGQVAGLTLGEDGPVWSLADRDALADLDHRMIPTGPRPATLTAGDLDGDGEIELVLAHDAGGIGVIDGGFEERQASANIAVLTAGDLDGDGCAEVLSFSGSPSTLTLSRPASCAGRANRWEERPSPRDPAPDVAPAPPTDPEHARVVRAFSLPEDERSGRPVDPPPPWDPNAWADEPEFTEILPNLPPPPTLFGVDAAPFLNPDSYLPRERMARQQYLVTGTGWVLGKTLGPVRFEVPLFPAVALTWETGSPRARFFVGGDTGMLFMWATVNGGAGLHLANVTAGGAFGSPRLRTGPFVTAGLVNVGAGIRTVWTPWVESASQTNGLELRLTYFAPSTGQVMLLWVWSEALRAPPEGESPAFTAGRSGCDDFAFVMGAVGGYSNPEAQWEAIGNPLAEAISMSPGVGLTCDIGSGPVALLLSAETAPFYSYINHRGERMRMFGTHTVGPMFGGSRVRVGPAATFGVWSAGAGARLAVNVKEDRQGLTHGFELRGFYQYPSAPAATAQLWYRVGYDPRG